MMRVSETGDPRLEALFGTGEPRDVGVRPVVRLPRSGPSPWLIAAIALIGSLLLFWILESRRGTQPQASVRERAADLNGYVAEPPPLYIPPVPAPEAPDLSPQEATDVAEAAEPRAVAMPAPAPAPTYYPPPAPPPPIPISQPPQATRIAAGPALVIDTTAPTAQPSGSNASGPAAGPAGRQWGGRVRASGLANRSTTVPQGVLIPAVLETAFDSNRPGLARAIVSRDVRGFDGTQVLIPRGSRIVGEYGSDVAPGQNRGLISWTRLVRPDGVIIALDSPSVDTLGRGGVRASVNTHFWERFGSALLRSTVDIGTGFATRAATGGMIVAVPGAVQNATPQQTTRYVPTLKIPAGKSISIFVARDLEFPEGNRQ